MQKLVKIGMMVAGVAALAVTIAFSFFAPGLAIVSGIVSAIMAVLWADYQRRSVWEKGASKDIDVLKKAMRNVSASVQDNRADIERLKTSARSSKVVQPKVRARAEEVVAEVLKVKPESQPKPRVVSSAPLKPEVREDHPPVFAEILKKVQRRKKVRPPRPVRAGRQDIGALVERSLKAKKVVMFVQPIVTLPKGKARFYEVFARLEGVEGLSVPANDYMSYARQNNVMSKIDGLLLMRSLRVIERSAHVKKATPFFVNVSAATLKDAAFMGQLLAFLKKKANKRLRERLIFEMSQEDYEGLPPVMVELMRGLGQLGCAFSLDHVSGFDLDVELMVKHRVRSIKVAAPLLIKEVSTTAGLMTMQKVIRQLEGNGIAVIVDRVESQAQLDALEVLGLSYAQGYLFGRPAPQAAYARKAKKAA